MKVREVRFQHIRGFGEGLRRVTFFDPDTDQVRPLSVLVGSNGCGKTTALQLIEAFLVWIVEMRPRGIPHPWPLLREVCRHGYAGALYELDGTAQPALLPNIWVSASRDVSDYGGSGVFTGPNLYGHHGPSDELYSWVHEQRAAMKGGLLYFPHDRWFEQPQHGGISEPPNQKQWLFHFKPHSQWDGSLAQLWVWQNYLDLEAGRDGRPNLLPFVELIEQILGRGRRVVIQKARVHIQDGDRRVELHELPSGEQQILALFGEIIRQLRPGAVILIDEVEISLHPALQRAVIAHLRELARLYDLQVIVTTHSMEIVRSVSPREIVNMDDMVQAEQGSGS